MRTLNSAPMTSDERDYLALVKQCCGCVFCGRIGETEAHHPRHAQGLHFCVISVCKDCHDLRVWTYCGMSELEALNETSRRVARLRNGRPIDFKPCAHFRLHTGRQASTRTPDKIMPRRL